MYARLEEQQLKILELVHTGLTNKEIAHVMHFQHESTVKFHLTKIYMMLGFIGQRRSGARVKAAVWYERMTASKERYERSAL